MRSEHRAYGHWSVWLSVLFPVPHLLIHRHPSVTYSFVLNLLSDRGELFFTVSVLRF